MEEKVKAFKRLLTIMDELREQCPWDKKQTIESLRHLTLEEVYELSDSIMDKDMKNIKKELGDILLHIVFYARIASETKEFDIADVMNELCEKLIVRHPHIYGDVKVSGEEEVKQNWEKIKLKEGSKSVLAGVPKGLPSLVKSIRIQEKARGVGFDWDTKQQVWDKVNEELEEFKVESEREKIDKKKLEGEFGDVMFALINYARFMDINPEDALEKTNRKFISRFTYMENKITDSGKKISDCKLPEMEKYWNEAKRFE
ncbi:MAG: nucleoside triphosphate pyrophosphohydrolase [Bacteroidia bacterium]|nr:nucleoside triphosphate pyrophosphohydrolase [Bacteroidia bacterium]